MASVKPQVLSQHSRAANRSVEPQDARETRTSGCAKRKRMAVKNLLNDENEKSQEILLKTDFGAIVSRESQVAVSPGSLCRSSLLGQEEEELEGLDFPSEPKDHPGMPTYRQFLRIIDDYLASLHERKRDKALITQEMHEMIYDTLVNPESTRLGTPQFRFWARKMFKLVDVDGEMVITHEGRPVAVKEHIYDILCMCHEESQHAGRDKTCKVIREYYTWIPKELTANFVKGCPTCLVGRPSMVRTSSTVSSGNEKMNKGMAVKEETDSLGHNSASPRNSVLGFFPTGSPNDARYQGKSHNHNSSTSDAKLEVEETVNPRSITSPHLFLPTAGFSEDLSAGSMNSESAEFTSTRLPRLARPGSYNGINIPLPPLMQYLSASNNKAVSQNQTQQPQINFCASTPLPPLMKYLQDPDQPANTQPHRTMLLPPIHTNPSVEIPIDPSLLSTMSVASTDTAKPSNKPRVPLAHTSTSLSTPTTESVAASVLPPTPLKLQVSPATLPNFINFDPDAEFLSVLPSATQIMTSVGLDGVGLGLPLGRTWTRQMSIADSQGRGHGSQRAYSGTSWSASSSEAGTPVSATFPSDVQSVGIAQAMEGGRIGYGYDYLPIVDTSLAFTVAKQDASDERPQKRMKVE